MEAGPTETQKAVERVLRLFTEVRDARPEMPVTQAARLASEQWHRMTADEKAPYEGTAAPELRAYRKALEEYKASNREAEWKASVGLLDDKPLAQGKLAAAAVPL